MLVIQYRNAGQIQEKTYRSANEFVSAQYREVPDLEDYYEIIAVTLDGKAIEVPGKTIGDLFSVLA